MKLKKKFLSIPELKTTFYDISNKNKDLEILQQINVELLGDNV